MSAPYSRGHVRGPGFKSPQCPSPALMVAVVGSHLSVYARRVGDWVKPACEPWLLRGAAFKKERVVLQGRWCLTSQVLTHRQAEISFSSDGRVSDLFPMGEMIQDRGSRPDSNTLLLFHWWQQWQPISLSMLGG